MPGKLIWSRFMRPVSELPNVCGVEVAVVFWSAVDARTISFFGGASSFFGRRDNRPAAGTRVAVGETGERIGSRWCVARGDRPWMSVLSPSRQHKFLTYSSLCLLLLRVRLTGRDFRV